MEKVGIWLWDGDANAGVANTKENITTSINVNEIDCLMGSSSFLVIILRTVYSADQIRIFRY
jgi:hypothetical protein